MKIKHLKYHQIDFEKYNNCIDTAINPLIYAYSWYLDIVSNKNWEVLILNDYQAVMPLPFARIKRKFFKKMIAQPFLCQQLGVFSVEELDKDTFQLFFDYLKTQKVHHYQFNSGNSPFLLESDNCFPKNNYELNLNKSYEDIKLNYSKNLKRNLKKASKQNLVISKKVKIADFVKMKKQALNYRITKSQFQITKTLLKTLQSKKLGQFYGVYKENNLIAIAFLVQQQNRIIHLTSVSTPKGKQIGAIPFLFDSIINNNAKTNVIFDFEGSMIQGIARFYKSFGAINKKYYTINNI